MDKQAKKQISSPTETQLNPRFSNNLMTEESLILTYLAKTHLLPNNSKPLGFLTSSLKKKNQPNKEHVLGLPQQGADVCMWQRLGTQGYRVSLKTEPKGCSTISSLDLSSRETRDTTESKTPVCLCRGHVYPVYLWKGHVYPVYLRRAMFILCIIL